MKELVTGKVVKAFGNLLHVAFDGNVRQGEVAMVKLGHLLLKGEVIELLEKKPKSKSSKIPAASNSARLSNSTATF